MLAKVCEGIAGNHGIWKNLWDDDWRCTIEIQEAQVERPQEPRHIQVHRRETRRHGQNATIQNSAAILGF